MESSSLMTAYAGMSAVGSTVSAVAQYQKGRAEKAAYEYNAEIALRKTKEEQEKSETEFTRLAGRQRALYATAGVDITSGSPLLILADTAYQAEMEQQRIIESGGSTVALQRFYGDVAGWSGTVGAASTFLTGLGKAGGQYQMGRKGVSSPWM